VAPLVGHNGASRREDDRVPYEWRGTQVRSDADELNCTRDRRHGRDAGEHAGEVVAAIDWLLAEISEDRLRRNEVIRERMWFRS
jgi:hypothetical protein